MPDDKNVIKMCCTYLNTETSLRIGFECESVTPGLDGQRPVHGDLDNLDTPPSQELVESVIQAWMVRVLPVGILTILAIS